MGDYFQEIETFHDLSAALSMCGCCGYLSVGIRLKSLRVRRVEIAATGHDAGEIEDPDAPIGAILRYKTYTFSDHNSEDGEYSNPSGTLKTGEWSRSGNYEHRETYSDWFQYYVNLVPIEPIVTLDKFCEGSGTYVSNEEYSIFLPDPPYVRKATRTINATSTVVSAEITHPENCRWRTITETVDDGIETESESIGVYPIGSQSYGVNTAVLFEEPRTLQSLQEEIVGKIKVEAGMAFSDENSISPSTTGGNEVLATARLDLFTNPPVASIEQNEVCFVVSGNGFTGSKIVIDYDILFIPYNENLNLDMENAEIVEKDQRITWNGPGNEDDFTDDSWETDPIVLLSGIEESGIYKIVNVRYSPYSKNTRYGDMPPQTFGEVFPPPLLE